MLDYDKPKLLAGEIGTPVSFVSPFMQLLSDLYLSDVCMYICRCSPTPYSCSVCESRCVCECGLVLHLKVVLLCMCIMLVTCVVGPVTHR